MIRAEIEKFPPVRLQYG